MELEACGKVGRKVSKAAKTVARKMAEAAKKTAVIARHAKDAVVDDFKHGKGGVTAMASIVGTIGTGLIALSRPEIPKEPAIPFVVLMVAGTKEIVKKVRASMKKEKAASQALSKAGNTR